MRICYAILRCACALLAHVRQVRSLRKCSRALSGLHLRIFVGQRIATRYCVALVLCWLTYGKHAPAQMLARLVWLASPHFCRATYMLRDTALRLCFAGSRTANTLPAQDCATVNQRRKTENTQTKHDKLYAKSITV